MGGATARAHSPNWVILDDAIEHHAVCGASSSCHANSNICGASSNILCNGSASDKCICDASNNCFIYDASNSILCSANDNCFIPDGNNIANAIRYLIAAIGATPLRPLGFLRKSCTDLPRVTLSKVDVFLHVFVSFACRASV